MKSLIWKEFRLCWPILLAGAVLLIAPYIGPFIMVLRWREPWIDRTNIFAASAIASLALSLLTPALMGGNAIACERADRSAEFLAYQPIFRGRILASKFVWPIMAAVVVWSINVLTIFCCGRLSGQGDSDTSSMLGMFFVIGLLSFSVAWLVSALQSSPTFAVASGIMAPVVIAMCFGVAMWLTDGRAFADGTVALTAYAAIGVVVAAGSLIYGCWYYVHRVEP